jgi:ABC-type nitrate/sulfonate/bicarbonate transport system ATPase subunit
MCKNDIQVVKSVLEEKRVNIEIFYHEIYEAVILADKVGIYPSLPRRSVRQTQRANIPSSSVEELFRRTITI